MIETILDFYNNKVNEILDVRLTELNPNNKDILTDKEISKYVDTLTDDFKESYNVYKILKDFYYNHLDNFQNIYLGLPNKTYLDMEENKKEAIEYLQNLYGDK